VTTPIQVKLLNGSTIDSTHTRELRLPTIPCQARKAHLFPNLAGHSLLSVSQLCDQGCDVIFTAKTVVVTLNNRTLLTRNGDPNGLWAVTLNSAAPTTPIPSPNPSYSANAVAANVPTSSNLRKLIQYLHACCFSPPKATWIDAIRIGHFTTWPALTVSAVSKLLPPSTATAPGHLDQKRKNLHSTQPKPPPSPSSLTQDDNADDLSPAPLPDGKRTNAIYAAISTIEPPTGKISSDQTGCFPVTASTGMKYVLVVYDYDSNAILAESLLNRGAKTILAAYTTMHTLLV
jgi:hypothetical protein